MAYNLKSKKHGKRIFPDKYNQDEYKYRSLRYITPKGYEIEEIDHKKKVMKFKKIKEEKK